MPIEPMPPVVVGVDGSSASQAAVDLAAAEATGRGSALVVIHALGRSPLAGRPAETDRPVAAHRLLSAAASRASEKYPKLAVTTELVPDPPVQALLHRAHHACLVVLGHRGHRAAGKPPAGAIARQVAGQAPVPVIVDLPAATPPAAPGTRPVVVGVACDTGTDTVVGFGFIEAVLRGAPLLAVHIWSRPADAAPAWSGLDRYDGAVARAESARALDEALACWSDKYPDVPVEQAVRHSPDVPVALTAASRGAQLTVVGATNRADRKGSLGPVAEVLLHRAGSPVAVVPVC